MRQPSSIEPFTPSPNVVLHPALQAALENLDVQIEEELARYRRQRRNPATATPRRKPFPASSSGATAIGILNHNIQLPTLRSSIYEHQAGQTTQATQVRQSPSPPVPSVAPVQQAPIQQAPVPPSQPLEMAAPTAPPVTFAVGTTQTNQVGNEAVSARIASYAEQHDLSAYTPSSTLQKFVQQPVADSASDTPDDYLASSEALLRSIAEEETQRRESNSHSLLDTLLTPMGIGSMLLLVLASTTLGYVIMNPASLGLWTPDATPDSSASPASTGPAATSSGAAPSPDLASDEFVDLGLGTLSTLPKQSSRSGAESAKAKTTQSNQSTQSSASKAKPSAAASNTTQSAAAPPEIPVAPAPQPSLSTVVVPAAPPVMSVPEPAIPAPEPAPVSPEPISAAPPPIQPAPAPEPAPSVAAAPTASTAPTDPNNYYYVVTEYSGDASLQQARSAVPDAYVRNLPSEGAKVQLGAFNDEAKAQELLQQLQQQGIQAEVYQP